MDHGLLELVQVAKAAALVVVVLVTALGERHDPLRARLYGLHLASLVYTLPLGLIVRVLLRAIHAGLLGLNVRLGVTAARVLPTAYHVHCRRATVLLAGETLLHGVRIEHEGIDAVVVLVTLGRAHRAARCRVHKRLGVAQVTR